MTPEQQFADAVSAAMKKYLSEPRIELAGLDQQTKPPPQTMVAGILFQIAFSFCQDAGIPRPLALDLSFEALLMVTAAAAARSTNVVR